MRHIHPFIRRYRKPVFTGLFIMAAWALLQNATIDNAIGLFVVSGVVPGTGVVLQPDIVMQGVVAVFAASISGFMVWLVMRQKLRRLRGEPLAVHLNTVGDVQEDIAEYTIWERPIRPVRLPRAALPTIAPPRHAVAAKSTVILSLRGYISQVLRAVAQRRSSLYHILSVSHVGRLPRPDYMVSGFMRVRSAAQRIALIVAQWSRVAYIRFATYCKVTARTTWKYLRVLNKRIVQFARYAWYHAESKLRQFDAYVERHVKRFQRWLHVKAAQNEMLSFVAQLYRQFLRRGKSEARVPVQVDVHHIDATTEKA